MTESVQETLIWAFVLLAVAGAWLAVAAPHVRAQLRARAGQAAAEAGRAHAEAIAAERRHDLDLRQRAIAVALAEATVDETAAARKAELAAQAARDTVAAQVAADTREARLDAELTLIRERADMERALLPETVRADLASRAQSGGDTATKVPAYVAYCQAMGTRADTWAKWAGELE